MTTSITLTALRHRGVRPARTLESLFDVQGPRARRRTAIATIIAAVVIATLLALGFVQLGLHGDLAPQPWLTVLSPSVFGYLLGGLGLSLVSGLVAGLLAFPFSVAIAVGRFSRRRWVRAILRWYVEITRSLPLLLLIFFVQLYLPTIGIRVSVFWQLVIPLDIYNVSVLAEVFRAGVQAVPPGQKEAADSLGLRAWQKYRLVLLPQAVRIVLPSLISQYIRLFKDTSLGFVVSFPELLTRGKIMGEFTNDLLQTYVIVGALYLLTDLVLAAVGRRLARRLEHGGRVQAPDAAGEAALSGLNEA